MSRSHAAIGVGLGILSTAFMGLFLFALGIAATADDPEWFVRVTVAVFALYSVITIWLFAARRQRAALIVAWFPAALPIVLSVVVAPLVAEWREIFG